jgi:hypothetical protein
MWFGLVSRKELVKELELIKLGFSDRDSKIEMLKEKVESQGLKIATIQGMLVQSGPTPDIVRTEPNRTKLNSFEKSMVSKVMDKRPNLIKQTIIDLINKDMRTSDMFSYIVNEKKLISKTQFYHYLSLVRNELRTELRTISRDSVKMVGPESGPEIVKGKHNKNK